MIENYKLPRKIRKNLEKEIESSEVIQWIEQPIPRILTRSTVGTCLVLLFSLAFFSFVGYGTYEQFKNARIPINEFPQVSGVLIPLVAVVIQLILIVLIPFLNWLEAVQSVYVITNKRAFVLKVGASKTVTSFFFPDLRVILRRENKDGSGDIIVYIHQSKDYDGDTVTEEIGFKQVRNVKSFENMLRYPNGT
ncbi:hypothetical protein H6F44_07270 [Pseudanabaena sp. FACHB-1277]|jgi:hypothetical protein|uniref:DUF304 domain-containing protein n=1 Tax=Pseudanabaena cinerea FACHB-1277 TaxID=2949581 RepID=A0A926URI9_9CYAN|nr:hypothetical protein [Pseudanabaena cinerea]MBD2149921.1 hypothetical protein [Pseudanabaena cinerea FACHB-1277]